MTTPSAKLQTLIAKLDELGPNTTLVGVANALTNTKLTLDDVAPYIRTTPSAYHRGRVIQRDWYELLVITWLPGQSSAPHDHAGSVCAFKVIQGTAVEGEYTVGSDGYADLEYESTIAEGQLSAGEDASAHTVRNPSTTETLVTVHVYAPALRNLRRFTIRSTAKPVPATPRQRTVAVIGGGFSGTMTAANLLRQNFSGRVALIERSGTIGEGLAYGTKEPAHLLNVPAGRMSAWPDRPTHFVEWLQQKNPATQSTDFVPRTLYGDYIRETLHHEAANSGTTLDVQLADVRRVAKHPGGGWMVHLDRGNPVRADDVVVALGHRPPMNPLANVWHGPKHKYLIDPWQPYLISNIPDTDRVLILGSGLTAVDTVLSLAKPGRTGQITLLSRTGLLPRPHATTPIHPVDCTELVKGLIATSPTVDLIFRAIRAEVRKQAKLGVNWRGVMDGLRPHTAALWQSLSNFDRKCFLQKYRQYWEVHRHRMAPAIQKQLHDLQNMELVRVQAGSVAAAIATDKSINVFLRHRGSLALEEKSFDWVINCTGPGPSNSAEASPVIGSLLLDGWVRPDELLLGLDVDANGNAVGQTGEPTAGLYVVGTLRKPSLWETTAVNELRQQAGQIAARITT
jgi:uncharacterized NAD(P)/FAD-binding protein YdhS